MNLIGLDANQLDVAKEGLSGILIFSGDYRQRVQNNLEDKAIP